MGLQVSLYNLGTLAAGFFIGYNEGKGIDVNPTVEYLTKYGPTTFAMATTPIMVKLGNTLGKWLNKRLSRDFQNQSLKIDLEDGTTKIYKDLNDQKKQEVAPRVVAVIENLESKVQNTKYLKPTLINGTKAAIETAVGYIAGRLCSQIN